MVDAVLEAPIQEGYEMVPTREQGEKMLADIATILASNTSSLIEEAREHGSGSEIATQNMAAVELALGEITRESAGLTARVFERLGAAITGDIDDIIRNADLLGQEASVPNLKEAMEDQARRYAQYRALLQAIADGKYSVSN